MRNRGLWALLCALVLLLPALLAGCEQATGGDPALTGTVTVNGDARVGAALTANISALGGEGTVSYQWQKGNTAGGEFAAIENAVQANYTLAAADEGKYLRVEVSRAGYSGSKTSAARGPVAADGDNENRLPGLYTGAETTSVAGVSGLASALAWIAANAVEEGRYTIILDSDETVPAQELHYTRTVGIDIRGYGEAPVIQLSGTGSLLSIRGTKQGTKERKVSVSLENAKLLGVADNDAALVTLGALSALELKSGAEISGNTHYLREAGIVSAYGGGVDLNPGSYSAELLINGGKISGNTVDTYGEGSDGFHFMWYAYAYGGGVCVRGGTLVMNSGEISGNTVRCFNSPGWPALAYGGGIYAIGGSVSIQGGTISGNTAEATGQGGTGEATAEGAGVYAGAFTFSNGEISSNTARSQGFAHGGGVEVAGTFTMEGGEIFGNTALSTAAQNKAFGGGVYLFRSEHMVKTGGLIRGGGAGTENNKTVNASQELQTDHGHAVYVDASDEHPGLREHYEVDISGNLTLPSL
jgi:hypothetical protein